MSRNKSYNWKRKEEKKNYKWMEMILDGKMRRKERKGGNLGKEGMKEVELVISMSNISSTRF